MKNFMKQDFLWNAIGSLTYAMASMVLAFVMVRLAGPQDGGIFGFGFSTLGQQLFIVAYFGIRPFHITDMRGEYRFGEYLRARVCTCLLAVLAAGVYLGFMTCWGFYDARRSGILFLLSLYKILDGFADVYESELQRQGRLYLTGQSLCFRTLCSVAVLLLGFSLTKRMELGCLGAVLMQSMGVYLFSYRPLMRCERAVTHEDRDGGNVIEASTSGAEGTETGALGQQGEGVSGVDLSLRRGRAGILLQNTSLLFFSVFLDFYVFSASKYAVDQVMGEAQSGMFNILFMPTSLIYLLANFCIRPMLTRLSQEYSVRDVAAFRKTYGIMMALVLGLSLCISLGALLLGRWGLTICELLLGGRYEGRMVQEWVTFFLLILGGAVYALCNVQYYVLVTCRKQREIFLTYAVLSILAVLTAGPAVRMGGLFYASVNYGLLMLLLFLVFTLCVFRELRELEGQKYRA